MKVRKDIEESWIDMMKYEGEKRYRRVLNRYDEIWKW